MNKQELIGKYEYLNHNYFRRVDTSEVLKDLKQLDEPQKVKVPPFVSVWYRVNKDNLYKNIAYLCANWEKSTTTDNALFNWMSNTDNFVQILVNMHQFGYEVEKDKLYRVKMKGNIEADKLVYGNFVEKYFFAQKSNLPSVRNYHTKKQLEKAGFGEVFNSTLFEVEEVEG